MKEKKGVEKEKREVGRWSLEQKDMRRKRKKGKDRVEWVTGRETGVERAEEEKIGEGGFGWEIMGREKTGGGETWGESNPGERKCLIEHVGEKRKRHDRAFPKEERTGRAMKVWERKTWHGRVVSRTGEQTGR
jgi:hypothetical protein